MSSPIALDRLAADRWFLARGLPAVLTPGRLVRRLWGRSAPALAALAVFMLNSVFVVLITGKHTIDIDGHPTRTEWFILALLVLVLPLAATTGWLVSRIDVRSRAAASTVSVAIAVLSGIVGGPSPRIVADLVFVGTLIAAILALTASGLGAILAWAVQVTLQNLALAGNLVVRALPVVLLTVLVFFNSYVWLMAATVSRPRLWLAVTFLSLIAVAFVTSSAVDRLRQLQSAGPSGIDDAQLAGTPFEGIASPPAGDPLSRSERWNVVFVLAMSQVLQVGMVAAFTALIFFVLGLILLSPQLLAEWTRNGASDGQILGMTLPVPDALIQISLFLGAMTFMYVSARAVGDAEYRSRFFDPLVDDLQLALVARDRYRATVSAR